MKKTLFLLQFAFSVSCFFAQKVASFMNQSLNYSEIGAKNTNIATIQNKAAGDVVYEETFSSIGTWTTAEVDGALWLHDMDGPNGQYSNPATQKIESTSSSNGFMIFDADLSNPAQPYSNRVGHLVSPIIDLSSTPNVYLYFEQFYRVCCSYDFIPKVELSSDGFQTVFTYDVSVFGVSVNDNSGTQAMTININDFLSSGANLSTVQVRFVFDGSAGTSHYFWQIDDVRFVEQYSHNLVSLNAWLGDVVLDFETTEVPTYFNHTLVTQMALQNLGFSNPSNTSLQVKVLDVNNSVVFTQIGGTLSNNFTQVYDTILFTTTLNTGTLAVGTYTVEMTVQIGETDGDLTNNVQTRTFSVSNDRISTFDYDNSIGYYDAAYNYRDQTTNQVPNMIVGTLIRIPSSSSDVFLNSVDIALYDGTSSYPSTLNENFRIGIWEYDPNEADFQSRFIQFSEEYTFQVLDNNTSNTPTFFTFNLSESLGTSPTIPILESGKYYYIGLTHDGGISKYLWYYATNNDDDYSSYIYGPFGANDETRWFTAGYDPLMRFNIQRGVGLEELSELNVKSTLYPNPLNTQEQLFLSLNLKEESTLSYKWLDLSGKVIEQSKNEHFDSGKQKLTVKTNNLDNGMYLLEVYLNNEAFTYKMNIQR
ncbi:MAG: T9SS type A sorting domain-containing protein [Flavobacteriia bacterium]|nr:T9SS type A sorting domain-containing protein [Flavobacteriia bacterium]